ncbi:unnamed protein product [Thlaspi arvense]|uniref:Uncharacterized protein n=1 Tax=Thlaspi arvense TaxID=13288 RepID=A0AAU9SU13_THLAR|nr:unnamed protein product [Thlaspi arvense]
MAHRNLRDDESDGSDFPMICDSSLNPCVRMMRAEVDNEADTSLTTPLQRLHISPSKRWKAATI